MTVLETGFQIHPFTPSTRGGFYDDEVAALLEAGPDSAITITVPTTGTRNRRDENGKIIGEQTVDATQKYRKHFRDAANRAGKTAREVGNIDNGDGTTAIEYILVDKIVRERKAK